LRLTLERKCEGTVRRITLVGRGMYVLPLHPVVFKDDAKVSEWGVGVWSGWVDVTLIKWRSVDI